MNTMQNLTKNLSVLFISQILSYIFGFFTLIYTARYLGVSGYGSISLALAFTGIFAIFVDLGLSTLITREIARNKSLASEYIASIIPIRIFMIIITLGIIFILINLMGYNKEIATIICIISLSMFFNAFTQIFYAIFQAYEQMEYKSIGLILNSAFILSGILIAINYQFDIIYFSMIYPIEALIILIYSFTICYFKFLKPKIKFNLNFSKELIKESWPFAITSVSFVLYLYIDTIILSFMKGPEAVGIYNASYNLINAFLFIPFIFTNAIFPMMSKYHISSKKALETSFEKYFKIMILLGFPLGIGIIILANQIILLVYGNKFINSVLPLQILIWSVVLIFARYPFQNLLESTNRQLLVTKIFIISILFNIILNLIIIPKYSYIGACIVNVLTDILIFSLLINSTKKLGYSFSKSINSTLLKILFSSLIMGLFLSYLSLNIFLMVVLGIIIYILVILALNTIDQDEIMMIKSILNR